MTGMTTPPSVADEPAALSVASGVARRRRTFGAGVSGVALGRQQHGPQTGAQITREEGRERPRRGRACGGRAKFLPGSLTSLLPLLSLVATRVGGGTAESAAPSSLAHVPLRRPLSGRRRLLASTARSHDGGDEAAFQGERSSDGAFTTPFTRSIRITPFPRAAPGVGTDGPVPGTRPRRAAPPRRRRGRVTASPAAPPHHPATSGDTAPESAASRTRPARAGSARRRRSRVGRRPVDAAGKTTAVRR